MKHTAARASTPPTEATTSAPDVHRPAAGGAGEAGQAMLTDVPSPIDLRLPEDARAWAESAMSLRPWRVDFFAAFARELAARTPPARRVLELGAGPGFLAEHLLRALPLERLVLLDFSSPMQALARARLADLGTRAEFVERSFKDEAWPEGLGAFDAVVTHQAVHELRHKRHAPRLHAQVRALIPDGASYLVCDHFVGEGGMTNDALYMSIDEQRQALASAGFGSVHEVLVQGGMVLHHAV